MGKTVTINNVEIFKTGTHNGDSYTVEDLQEMVASAGKVGFDPPVKLGHMSDSDTEALLKEEGLPALGWVRNLKVKGQKLLADLVDVPRRVAELIKKGAYKRVSAEIYWNYRQGSQTFPRVLKAVALLGAEIPALTDLKAVEALYDERGNEFRSYQLGMCPMPGTDLQLKAKDTVDYRLSEGSLERCGTCRFYLGNSELGAIGHCTLVEGEIASEAICDLYEAREAFQFPGGNGKPEEHKTAKEGRGIKMVMGRLKGETTMTVQTIIFDKEKWTAERARGWLKDHDFKSSKLDETDESLRFRQREPGDFQPGSFRTIEPGQKKASAEGEGGLDYQKVTDSPWDGDKAKYEFDELLRAVPKAVAEWARKRAKDEDREVVKDDLKLLYKEPDGTINLNGVRAALAAIGGARTGKKPGLPADVLDAAREELEAILEKHKKEKEKGKKASKEGAEPVHGVGGEGGTVNYEEILAEKEREIAELKAQMEGRSNEDQERMAKLTALQAELDSAKAELEKARAESEKARAERRQGELRTFVDTKKREGRILPRFETKVMALLESADEGRTVVYSDGSNKVELTQRQLIESLISDLPELVQFKELAKGSGEGQGEPADDPAEEVLRRVRKYRAEHPEVSYEQAMKTVLASDPDLKARYAGMEK